MSQTKAAPRMLARASESTSRPAHQARHRPPWRALAVVSVGGAVGALARHVITLAWPHSHVGFPWAIFAVNATGCLLLGVLMVVTSDIWPTRPLVRLFIGTGVLGGYTTFSTYIVDVQSLLEGGQVNVALFYVATTLLIALLATYCGTTLAHLVISHVERRRE